MEKIRCSQLAATRPDRTFGHCEKNGRTKMTSCKKVTRNFSESPSRSRSRSKLGEVARSRSTESSRSLEDEKDKNQSVTKHRDRTSRIATRTNVQASAQPTDLQAEVETFRHQALDAGPKKSDTNLTYNKGLLDLNVTKGKLPTKSDKNNVKTSIQRKERKLLSKVRRNLFQVTKSSSIEDDSKPDMLCSSDVQWEETQAGHLWENLKMVNLDLREQVSKLRYQLEAHKGKIKQILWQKVLDIRKARQSEQKRFLEILNDQREKMEKEKSSYIDTLQGQLLAKSESDLTRLARHKDAEINKLRMEVSSKDAMLHRLLGDNRQIWLKLNIDDRKSKLVHELKDLRQQKKELEDSLTSASSAERSFSDELRRYSQNFEQEISRVKREAQNEVRQMIEQLKNKDKLISQLEKDLGQQWVAAQLAALEREAGEETGSLTMDVSSHPLSVLPEDSVDPTTYFWTPTSTSKTGSVEDGRSVGVNDYTTSKQCLPKKMKDLKERNKELVEKCRAYLHRTKELTAQNRAYKDSSDKMLHENKKMQELLEHSKLRVLQLTRQLSEQKLEGTPVPDQREDVEQLKRELTEERKANQALRQACSEKDRRLELIQHRKRRRTLLSPAGKNLGIRETIYGYDEDKSMDSDASISSVSHSTLSEDEVWDRMISTEETERGYHKLMAEQLQLQRAHALLQKQTGNCQDPQREQMAKIALQNDLFHAQCRIEKLEQLINEIGEGDVLMLLKEREVIVSSNKDAMEKATMWEKQSRQLQQELNKAQEKIEDLEFQLMELENCDEDKKTLSCNQVCHSTSEVDSELVQETAVHLQESEQEMEQLRKEISALLKGREGETVLKKFDKVREDEKKHAASLESMAHELQMKVITLQKEKDSLQDKLNQKGQKQGKSDSSFTVAAREKQENLELKAELSKVINSENKLLEERIQLLDELNDWKTQYDYLKQQLDLLTQSQQPTTALRKDSSSNEASPSSYTSSLTRRPSKDRKSKPRSGDDPTQSKRRKSDLDYLPDSRCQNSSMNIFEHIHGLSEVDVLKTKVKSLEAEVQNIREENVKLKDQLEQCTLEKSSAVEADQRILLDKLDMLHSELDLVRRENVTLTQRLKLKVDELHDSQEELNPRVAELEDYCEDLQERLHAAEMTERQMKEKLRLVEGSIDEAETNEMAMREKYERLLAWEAEARKQIRELQKNGQELKELVFDKDFMEQALREKVDFLQKCEAASVRRIEELEAIERDLREQLESRTEPKGQRELNKIQELKHQITFLETDNRALAARVSELEENEETLRENWRRVADEDYNRTQTLEEKVKMLESMNRDLKCKLSEAQEYLVINVSAGEKSLAAELAQSQSSLRDAVVDSTAPGPEDGGEDSVDSQLVDQEKVKLMEKLKKLKRQLSDVVDKKDMKIESLQEKIVSLKETEIKLSETISEMEMTERELRAKLALYESSEVTVEKMLKYQSKIEELRTSQESLLDQLESLENQEMTLQEKMQEMERTLRGKIVTLEVEMKGYKQKELKSAARIRELEKQEKELSEKVGQQAEKENSLYIKISSLMDELKSAKEEVENLKSQLSIKEDKIRKAKLLEVKLLEIEMEYAKKISDISTKLRRKEEELRQKEASCDEEVNNLQNEVATLQSALNTKESEKNRRIAILEKLFAQKENDFLQKISSFEENIKELTNEKTMFIKQIQDLKKEKTDLESKDNGYQQELDILRQEVTSIKSSETDVESKISQLERSYNQEKQRAIAAENKVDLLERELAKEKRKVSEIEVKLIAMKGDIGEKMKSIETNFMEKETEYEKELTTVQRELELKEKRVKDLEGELARKIERIIILEAESTELKITSGQQISSVKVQEFQQEISELEKKWKEKEKNLKDEILKVKTDGDGQVEELKKKCQFLNTQLLHEAASKEQLETALTEAKSKVGNDLKELNKQLDHYKLDLTNKVKELENKTKEVGQLNLEVSQLHSSNKSLQKDLQNLRDQLQEKERNCRTQLSEKDAQLKGLKENIQRLQAELASKEKIILEASKKEKLLEEKQKELSILVQEKSHEDMAVQEKIQKSEQMLVLSQREKESKVTEVDRLKKDLEMKEALIKQYSADQKVKEKDKENLLSQIHFLEAKLKELTKVLEQKTVDAENYEKELIKVKKDKDVYVNEIQELNKKIEEKHLEIEKKSLAMSSNQSVISAKQLELEQARRELEKCLQDIQEYKTQRDQDKAHIQEQDQAYQQLSLSYEQLNLHVEEQNIEHKHLEFKMADVEQKLVEAENRYRELEAKCCSLEMQASERFTQSQQAEKVIKLKDEYLKLETKLESVTKDFEQATTQVQEAEKIIILKDKEFKLMKSKMETVGHEYDTLKSSLDKKMEECHKLKNDLAALQKEHDSLKKEADFVQKSFQESQSEHQVRQTECNELKLQVANLQRKWEDANNNLRASDDYMMQADHSFKSLEKKCKETEARIKIKEKLIEDLEKTLQQKQEALDDCTSKLMDREKKISDLGNQLKTLETEVKDKYTEIDHLYRQMDKKEIELKSCEDRCNVLKQKLSSTESELHEKHIALESMSQKVSVLDGALKEKEIFCRDSQNDFDSLEHQHLELKIECENLKSKLNYFQQKLDHNQDTCKEKDNQIKHLETTLKQSQQKMSETERNLIALSAQLKQLQQELKSSQEEKVLFETKLQTLSVEMAQVNDEKKNLANQVNKVLAELTESKQTCNDLRNDLEVLNKKSKEQDLQMRRLEEKCQQLELESHELQKEKDHHFQSLGNLELNKNELFAAKQKLEKENSILSAKLKELEDSFNSKESEFTELINTNQTLSGKVYKLEAMANEKERKLKTMEEMNNALLVQKDEALRMVQKLKEELEETSMECQNMSTELEDRHLRIQELLENNVNLQNSVSISTEQEKLAVTEQHNLLQQFKLSKDEIKDLERKLKETKDFNTDLEKTVSVMKKDLTRLKENNLALGTELQEAETNINKLSRSLSDTQTQLQIVKAENEKLKNSPVSNAAQNKDTKEMKEPEITVSLIPGLHTAPHSNISKEQDLAEKLHSLEIHHEESLSKVEKLLKDIESYKTMDQNNQKKLKSLEQSLKEMKDKEKKMLIKVTEFEEKEKQLLEQIADIETTVIIPLETENQELKDELSVVKQERDDARAGRWNDEDLDMASAHKALEEALIQRDELEKKVSILAEELKFQEEEKEKLAKQMTDLKMAEGEYIDKLEFLEDEVERLRNIELQKSVVEEHLMDRVLDLEEKEKMLQEKNRLKIENQKSESVQTEHVGDDLLKKLEYLQQKNEVLQDAESKYMDKILDLEGMLSENQKLKSHHNPNASTEYHNVEPLLENRSENINSKYATDLSSITSSTADVSLPLDQSLAPEDLSLLRQQNQSLLEECKEKTLKIQYLESKIVLLHDSEAKLMEKLTEEIPDSQELRQKIENLIEENEFLVQSIESVKKLYKEEKEKCSELQDRFMEEGTVFQELQEMQSRYQASEMMVEDVQAEYEEQLSEKEQQLNQLNKLLSVSQLREKDLEGEVQSLRDYIDSLDHPDSNTSSFNLIREELEQQIADLRTHHEHREQDLRKQLELIQLRQEESHRQHQQQVLKLEHYIHDLRHHEIELLKQVDIFQQHEKTLQSKLDSLESQLRLKDESMLTDSGMLSDEQKIRADPFRKVHLSGASSPVSEVFSTKVTLTLAKPPPGKTQSQQQPTSGHSEVIGQATPPHRGKLMLSSASHEELVQLVEELQNTEILLRSRLEALPVVDAARRVEELESINLNLQRKLRFAESRRAFQLSPLQDKPSRSSTHTGDNNNNQNNTDPLDFDQRVTMLDKSEHVLLQRIKDLETVDKHNQTQLSELERDRESLHEIARKDKIVIHDLQVKIRELQLSERGLKDQVNNLEASEGSLYTKCENLEVARQQLEDRVHELEIHERRLRELVRRLKLNEEHWLSKSGGMENAVAELSANEVQLKRLLQDVEMEKGGLSERAEYLEARVRELENVELTLMQRIKTFEMNEAALKNRLGHLENSEAAAHSKVYELDIVNVDLSQRLQKAVEECSVLSQHVSQLQGQINDLDRRLLTSKDSEMSYRHHAETLEKNENLMQKKVREYELRDIDSQAKIRELEQTIDILNDKMGALQRSENKLKYRIQELEETLVKDAQMLDQAHKVPQKLEDCQKYVVVLHKQIENLQQQLSNSLPANSTKVGESVPITVDEYIKLQKQSALLEESCYQLEEVEKEKEKLSANILQLRQGKGACGHEVEIEVLRKRMISYKTLFNKLKFSLSDRQATSLLDSEQDSDLLGDSLPAHYCHELETERVLQPISGTQDGKAEHIDAQRTGLTTQERNIVQSTTTVTLTHAAPPIKSERKEESHWKAIEARKPKELSGSWGGATDKPEGGSKHVSPIHFDGAKRSSTPEVEEVTVACQLQSESELSSHYKTQNDTDSSDGPVPPPRRGRVSRSVKSSSGPDSGESNMADTTRSLDAAHKKHFGDEKSLPPSAIGHQSKHAPLNSFAEDSFYLPSSTQEGMDSLDDGEAPPLPVSGPPEEHMRQERRDSLEGSTSGMSIKDRIAMIEKQLQTEKTVSNKSDNDPVFYWKKKSTENLRQAEVLDKDNKFLKEDLPPAYRRKEKINRLEKELEEKRRYIHLLENWLTNIDDLFKNQSKQTDREVLENLQEDLIKLRRELSHIGYRREDALLDAAALKTELERRDKEIIFKRNEIEGLVMKLKQSQEECQSIELMRRNALDSLRSLEKEVVVLQKSEAELRDTKDELQNLKKQSDVKNLELKEALTEKKELDLTLEKIILERDSLKCDLNACEEIKDSLKSHVESLKKEVNQLNIKIEEISSTEVRNSNLAEHINKLNELLSSRTEKIQEVYSENLELRERVHKTDAELTRLRNLCDDYNNLSARFDELKEEKIQSSMLVQELQNKIERLARKCQEKDKLLRRLAVDLKRSAYRPSSALEEWTKHEKVLNQEDYNLEFPMNEQSPQRPARNKRISPVDQELSNISSDTESTSSLPVTGSRVKRPSPYNTTRPRSAEGFSNNSRVRLNRDQGMSDARREDGRRRSEINLCQFVAIADYDPAIFSQSGRPGLELELREGDAVYIMSPMDKTGYYEAEVNGRSGLVPANYLQPLAGSAHLFDYNKDPQGQHKLDHASSQPHKAPIHGKANGSVMNVVPDPPQNFHVKGIVNNRGLLLSWLPPKVDSRGCTKGFQLQGYMVYVNNQPFEQISNPRICEFVLEHLNLEHTLHLAVQSLCSGGQVSSKAELVFEGIIKMSSKETVSQRKGQDDTDTDLSSVLNSVHYKRGHRKAVMALYDYSPKHQSPHDYTAFELPFTAGDIIHVYGEPRPDGFFHGEVNGNRGLIPACFVEDLSKIDKPGRKTGKEQIAIV